MPERPCLAGRATYGDDGEYWPGPGELQCECNNGGVIRVDGATMLNLARWVDPYPDTGCPQFFITTEVCMFHFIVDFERLFPGCRFWYAGDLHHDLLDEDREGPAERVQPERVWDLSVSDTQPCPFSGTAECIDVHRSL